MHISELNIFSKDTDANEIIRGYKYQELKTLEVWLHNKVNGINEHIYCDYEEDIFQRDYSQYKATFKQIKLYSSKNFSFSSVEVTKGLTHFFMLFVKPDYLFDEPLFVFETNTEIARNYGDNDAKLLSDWRDNQDKLDKELLDKCIEKVKGIIASYIQEMKKELIKKKENVKPVNEAEILFDKLPPDTWEKFIKSIKWEFSETTAEQAIENCTSSIDSLISLLPFPISREESDVVFATLQKEVGDRSIQEEPENRCLTNPRLDELLLNLGNESDKIYQNAFSIWKDVKEIKHFFVGEFYQILHSTKHCRRNKYLKEHSQVWITLLNEYINIDGIIPMCRREAIYELVWITLRPEMLQKPENSLRGLEPIIEEYFEEVEGFSHVSAIEDALNLFATVFSTFKFKLIDIKEKKLHSWFLKLEVLLDKTIAESKNANEQCCLLEIKGFLLYQKRDIGIGKISKEEIAEPFDKIISLLDEAQLFPVSQLGKRIDSITNILISANLNEDNISFFEQYGEKLLPYVEKRESENSIAKRYVEKGITYLKSENQIGLLKSLKYFHKAKDLWLQEETFEGYVLALINIARLYAALGMNLAAKYYALCGVWVSINNGNSKLYKRISDSFSLVLHADFRQGAWINALENLEKYITARNEFDTKPMDLLEDEILRNSLFESAMMLSLGTEISIQTQGYIEYQKSIMGQFYEDFLADFVEEIKVVRKNKGVNDIIGKQLTASPFSDLGEKREIEWRALGIDWKVTFPNDFIHNSIGEEFCGFLQIIHVDMAFSETDFHLLKSGVEIQVVISEELKKPEQLPSTNFYKWKVFMPMLESKEVKDINFHCAKVSTSAWRIMDELSLLPTKEFQEGFHNLFKKQDLANKTLTINSYQRIYRKLGSEENFNQAQRTNFDQVNHDIEFVEIKALEWEESISPKYNEKTSKKNIEGRYNNGLKAIHLSLEKLKRDKNFIELICTLRQEGWFDWQITMSLMNVFVDFKTRVALENQDFSSETEYLESMQKKFHEILGQDEKENYVDIPFDEIEEGMRMQFKLLPIQVLRSFKLESKSQFSDHNAIKELLNKRFQFDVDDTPEFSPFKDIK